MKAKEALQNFFQEKEIENQVFVIEHNGKIHMVDSDFVKDLIINHTPPVQQEQIRAIIARIDFRNGDVNHFLKHLAEAYVKTNF